MTVHLRQDEHLAVSAADGLLTVTIRNRARRNALDDGALATFVAALEQAQNEEAVRALLIAGDGPDFCSGFDIVGRNAGRGAASRVGAIQRRLPSQAHRLIPLLLELQVPVVAAVQGLRRGHRPAAAAGQRLRGRGRRRGALGAVRAARHDTGRRRELAAPARGRPASGPPDAAAGPAPVREPRPGNGGSSTSASPTTTVIDARRELAADPGRGPDRGARPDEVAGEHRLRAQPQGAADAGEPGHGAVLAQPRFP